MSKGTTAAFDERVDKWVRAAVSDVASGSFRAIPLSVFSRH